VIIGVGRSVGVLVGDGGSVGSSDPPVQGIAIPTISTVETTIHFCPNSCTWN